MKDKTVNWKIFDIDPWNDDEDVSKAQVIEEFKKYKGNESQFESELSKRFGWSGMMLDIVNVWLCGVEK